MREIPRNGSHSLQLVSGSIVADLHAEESAHRSLPRVTSLLPLGFPAADLWTRFGHRDYQLPELVQRWRSTRLLTRRDLRRTPPVAIFPTLHSLSVGYPARRQLPARGGSSQLRNPAWWPTRDPGAARTPTIRVPPAYSLLNVFRECGCRRVNQLGRARSERSRNERPSERRQSRHPLRVAPSFSISGDEGSSYCLPSNSRGRHRR